MDRSPPADPEPAAPTIGSSYRDGIVTAADINVTFSAPAGERAQLSKACLATIDAIYRHPLSHNLEWSAVIALFTKLGTVQQKSSNEMAFEIGGAHHVVRKSHTKDLTTEEVMAFRHMLTRAGWSPAPAAAVTAGPGASGEPAATAEDLLVVVDHHEARLYHLDVRSSDPVDDVILPYDPHHFLHHLAHKDRSRERGQRATEDPGFYSRIAEAVVSSGRIVVVGHGEGHSNAAHHLIDYLKLHHPETRRKVTCEVVADLSSLTPAQLLVLGRRALSD
jgi:hypothetical protein